MLRRAKERDRALPADLLTHATAFIPPAVAALGANMLKLKPCIEVKDGKMGVCKKYRGSPEHAFAQYVQERLEGRTDIRPELAFITHPAAEPSVVRPV